MDESKYKKIFLEEAAEHIRNLNDGFIALEKDPQELSGIDECFRHAHSMKGMASSMGYEGITSLSHAMEDALDLIKKREIKLGKEATDLLLRSLDALEKMVAEVAEGDYEETRAGDLVESLRQLGGVVPDSPVVELSGEDLVEVEEEVVPEKMPPVPPTEKMQISSRARNFLSGLKIKQKEMVGELISSGLHPYFLTVDIESDSEAPGARAFIILHRLAKAGVIVHSVPGMDEIKEGNISSRIEVLYLFRESQAQLIQELKAIPEIDQISIEGLTPEMLISQEEKKEELLKPKETPRPKLPQIKKKPQTVRVDTTILDDLINIVGELLISHERLETLSTSIDDEELGDELSNLGNLVRRFQETIMEVRMMPLDLIAGRFPRIIRDLSRRARKDISFNMEGREIELDRAILEEVGEVLIHILRNAVDHGIERPEEREKKGKPRAGNVRFKAYREKDWVIIRIEDDGQGIDLDTLRTKALEMGLVSQDILRNMNREEVLMLTSVPGFSTAKEVTDISGRGVGLDAVRAKVESLGGALAIESAPDQGTSVTIRIPISLAIVQILVVSVAGDFYGLPVAHIHHTTEIGPDMIKKAGEQEYFKDGRFLVKLQRLNLLLGIRRRGPDRRSGPVVIVEKGRRKYGLMVDELVGARDAVIKAIGQPLMRIPVLAGSTILGDGRPMIILDVQRLL